MKRKQQGFTLIEIAIVLLIIGLLLGGVMKGQSLINSARVRSIANDLSGIEAAWVSFRDRYRAVPGDYSRASTHIDTDSVDGDANSLVNSEKESGAVWQHLAAAGFISGDYSGDPVGKLDDTACTELICPSNPFSGFYKIAHTSNAMDANTSAHELVTGGNIPVEVMFELDLKIDDGKPNTGKFRAFNQAPHTNCVTGTEWNVVSGEADCAGVLILPL
jgi:prepilin-type N-terminal cleavage/methylation domain-containing protein